jgi:hypothetical protein
MATEIGARLSFLPWVRQGAAAGIAAVDTLGAGQAGSVKLTASVALNGAPAASLPVRLLGPADVLGLDPRQIVRTDPRPGTAGFEPNYLAAIEFDRPDFPWLFTPAKADATGRLRPWLCLVVVRRQAGVSLQPAGDTPLPALDIAGPAVPAEELPDLGESWLWAHSQLAGTGSAAETLAGSPTLSLSRLLCPRLLEPDTDYLACLVPAFELGRKAGLGVSIADAETTRLDPAWTLGAAAPAELRLPVYYHWDFRTGTGGDFESLVMLLKARPAPPELGRRPVAIDQPGFALPATFPDDAALDVGGALQPLDLVDGPPAWPPDTQAAFQTALAPILNAPGLQEAVEPAADPLLAPPLYGRWHAARPTVRADAAGAIEWLDELNLDPRHRAVASFGTQVVQEHQEALMAAAWEQAGALQNANQQLRQLQLGLFVGRSLHARHFARLSADALLRVGAPALTRIKLAAAPDAGEATATLAAQLSRSTLPLRAVSPAMRRLARPLGPINRRLVVQGVARPTTVTMVTKLGAGLGLAFLTPPAPNVITFSAVRSRLGTPSAVRLFSQVTADTVQGVFGRPFFRVVPEGQPVPKPPGVFIALPDNAAAARFRVAARAHLAKIDAGRLGIMVFPLPTQKPDDLRTHLLAQIAPQRSLVALAGARVAFGADATPPPGTLPVEPVLYAPRFRQAMYEPLRDLSQDLLLPGLESVLPNSVIGLQTNRRFVEAYLVGLNHEMGHELLWRGFPTDQRGTCFDRFWDTRGAEAPRPDIEPIHRWGARRLGDAANAPARERFVMLLRSELLRLYPTAVIYATRALLSSDGTRRPSADAADEVHPAFRGSMQPDVSFFGFDLSVPDAIGDPDVSPPNPGYYVVIQEQPSEPRFGFDVDTPRPAATHLRVADGAPAGVPLQGLTWGKNAAHMAGITRQMPVRVAIHASQFVAQ